MLPLAQHGPRRAPHRRELRGSRSGRGLLKPPEDCEGIEDVREGIDGLDREFLRLLGRRARYVATAARFKTGGDSVRAPERQQTMLTHRRAWAEEEGLDPDFVEDLYRRIVSHFISREMDHWRKGRA